MELKNFISKEQMSRAAAAYTADLIRSNAASGKVFSFALSGGSSPVRFYELLAEEAIDWSMVKVFLVDERKVKADHKHSNFRMIKESLLSKVNMPDTNIFSPKTEIESASDCAAEYEERIRKFFGNKHPVFDLIVLGVGPDGHTASLFPGKNDLLESNRFIISTVAPEQFDISERITMTLPLINRGNRRIFVILGNGKEEMVKRVLNRDITIPAGMINSDSLVFTDFGSPAISL